MAENSSSQPIYKKMKLEDKLVYSKVWSEMILVYDRKKTDDDVWSNQIGLMM
jgi:hypothetical protein